MTDKRPTVARRIIPLQPLLHMFLLCVFISLISCFHETSAASSNRRIYKSYRDIPNITAGEIEAIESLRERRGSFVYGIPETTEAFLDADGEIRGYAALLCEWLTELFGIPFIPEYVTWTELLDGLKSGHVDFTGELTPSDERRQTYFMTSGIANRWLCYFRLEGAEPLWEIARTRPLRYALIEGSTNIQDTFMYETETFEPVYIAGYEQAYELLKTGQVDALVTENTAEAFFDVYGDIVTENFFPFIDSPVSLSTQNPQFEPVISVVQKALEDGASRYLSELYDRGYSEYKKHRLLAKLTIEEKEYLNENPVIPYAAEYDNYPLSFFNMRNNEWQGVSFDVLKEVEALTGLKFALVNDEHTEWHELLKMLETGQALFVTELLRTPEREGRFLWPDAAISFNRPVLISMSDHDNINISKVPTVKVGVQRDTAYVELFRSWFPNHSNVIIYESQSAYYNALLNGEVDMIMSSYNSMLYLTAYLERVDIKPNIFFDNITESTFGFYKDAALLCSIFDKALELIDVSTILDQWTSRTYDYRAKVAEAQRPLLIGAVILSLVVLVLVIIIFYRDRKAAIERAVSREFEERTKLMLDANPLSMILIDKNFKCIYVNDESVRLYGLSSKQEYLDLYSAGRLVLERGGEFLRVALKEGHWHGELIARKPDGEIIPCEVTMIRVKYRGDDVIAGYARDLREERAAAEKIRKAEEEKLTVEESNQKLQAILEMLPVGIFIISRKDGSLLYYNKTAVSMYNSQSFERYGGGRSIFDFMPEFQPDGRRSIDVIMESNTKESGVVETQNRKLTGETFWTRTAYCVINYNGIDATLNAIEDITAELEHQQMLKTIALKEQEASQLKSRFLAKMSHEIRTPMNAIIGMSELALRENDVDAKNAHIYTVKQSGTNLLSLINDILDLSKIESGKLAIVPAEYSVPSLLNDVINIIRMRIMKTRLRFGVRIDSKIPHTLIGDESRIRQVLINILGNAVKYTDDGFVSLFIHGRIADDFTIELCIEVKDSGIGIKQEDIGSLFNDFVQFDIERNKGIEGVGLGLSISNSIVRAMGGKISVESEYGAGSTFTVTFPQKYKIPEPLAVVAEPENKSVLVYERRKTSISSIVYAMENLGVNYTVITSSTELHEKMSAFSYDFLFIPFVLFGKDKETIVKFGKHTRTVFLSEYGESVYDKDMSTIITPVYCVPLANILNGVSEKYCINSTDEQNSSFTAPGVKILIVDDIYTNLYVAQGLMKQYNMDIDLCNSGKAAIEAVESVRYDLIFMDHRMPGIDGIEATQRIRALGVKDSYYNNVPIIALTANAVSGTREMFLKNGLNDFLSKPIDTAKLHEILKNWIPKEKQVSVKNIP